MVYHLKVLLPSSALFVLQQHCQRRAISLYGDSSRWYRLPLCHLLAHHHDSTGDNVQLTSFTDYGLRALSYLATLPAGKMTSINEVSVVFCISRHHMVKIINQLSHQGYVDTVRGRKGGIRLAKPAQDIVIGQVIRDLEPLQLVECNECHITPACRLKAALHNAVQAFLQELDKHTLADLIQDNHSLYKLLLGERVTLHAR